LSLHDASLLVLPLLDAFWFPDAPLLTLRFSTLRFGLFDTALSCFAF
jgi:hypothetical protein